MSFQSFQFHPTLTANIKALGYSAPTPIQAEAMPAVLAGRDLMGLAQTGTGKTAAFLLPILQRILSQPAGKRTGVQALVIAPTRELAEQIHEAAGGLARRTGILGATVYGGVAMNPQVRALRQGVDLIIACPGRLLDHLNQGNVRFDDLQTLVLDEADHMFDMGFLPDIRRILASLPTTRQTLLFSATMPGSIKHLAEEILRDPVKVSIGHQAPVSTVSHAIYSISPVRKAPLLLELLQRTNQDSMIVFTRTKHRAKKLALHLSSSGHRATSLQGNLSQRQRQAAMDGFRKGTFRVLVATDIAARGIDVSQVGHVVNYDMPDTPEAYTHRIGRTGRAECAGQAHTFVTREDQSMVRAVERILGKPLPRRTLEGFDPTGSSSDQDISADRPGSDRPWSSRPRPGQLQGRRPEQGRRFSSPNRPQQRTSAARSA